MIDIFAYEGFCLEGGDSSLEARELTVYCLRKNIEVLRVKKGEPPSNNYVPCGSVEFCIKGLQKELIPNYYPKWLDQFLYRKVWREDKWPLKKVFIKPADKYKRFTGFVTTGTYKKKKKPPFWCSEIVNFTNEWRYYISNGLILTSEWYYGDEINTPEAPIISLMIPSNYCGAVDFGSLITGEIALVEAHHPIACGWYGNNIELYLQWLIDGWRYLQSD